MTLQYAKEVLIMEWAQIIENKNKEIASLSIDLAQCQYRLKNMEDELNALKSKGQDNANE